MPSVDNAWLAPTVYCRAPTGLSGLPGVADISSAHILVPSSVGAKLGGLSRGLALGDVRACSRVPAYILVLSRPCAAAWAVYPGVGMVVPSWHGIGMMLGAWLPTVVCVSALSVPVHRLPFKSCAW